MSSQWANSRNLKERIVIEGILTLVSPAHFGTGDTDSLTDMPLLLDEVESEKRPLLTGASLAGALRNFLVLQDPKRDETCAKKLFGTVTDESSQESYFIINDALGKMQGVELRDGVAIDPKTRTALDGKKFDYELLEAGTTFDLRFELLVPKSGGEDFVENVAKCLTGLEKGKISLGKRKRRGFGSCKASSWKVKRFDMTTPEGMLQWLEFTGSVKESKDKDESISKLLNSQINLDDRNWFSLEADFIIDGSILIRSGSGLSGDPDSVHLHRKEKSEQIPIVSGTSIAGALRSRTIKIGNTLGKDGYKIANELFGAFAYKDEPDLELTASRVWVDEAEIKNPIELIQSRLKIDRFTGGAYPGALFSEQPVFGDVDTGFRLKLRLFEPKKWEVGLFLLLLKDLWLGDLTLGGESSVGRGHLCGKYAKMTYEGQTWEISSSKDGALEISGSTPKDLQVYTDEFVGVQS
jgi:CRISPR/Cas system CSM-associated protein Csm3 (group 7 of RAMP superfamily)